MVIPTSHDRTHRLRALLKELELEIKLAREDLRQVAGMPEERDRLAGIAGTGATAARHILALGSSYRAASRGAVRTPRRRPARRLGKKNPSV